MFWLTLSTVHDLFPEVSIKQMHKSMLQETPTLFRCRRQPPILFLETFVQPAKLAVFFTAPVAVDHLPNPATDALRERQLASSNLSVRSSRRETESASTIPPQEKSLKRFPKKWPRMAQFMHLVSIPFLSAFVLDATTAIYVPAHALTDPTLLPVTTASRET